MSDSKQKYEPKVRFREIQKIKTNITSSLDVSPDNEVFSLVTRQLATTSSKYLYRLEVYNLTNFKKLKSTDIYESYNQLTHYSKILNDGQTVVVATTTHIIFYNRKTLKQRYKALHLQENIYSLEASHNGRVVAMVGDNVVKMWDTVNLQIIQFSFLIPTARKCFFSYDNKYFAVSSTTIINLYEIRLNNGNYEFLSLSSTPEVLEYGTVSSFEFNPQNSAEIVVGFSNVSPRFYNFIDSQYRNVLSEQQPKYYDNYKQVAYLPDSKRIISADYTEGVGLWPGANKKLLYKQNYLFFGVHPFNKGRRAIGFVWQQVKILQLEIQCEKNAKYTLKCECRQNFRWDESQYRCVRISCDDVEFATGKVSGKKCECLSNYTYNEQLNKCILNCKGIQNAIHVSPLSSTQCFCQPGYLWIQNKCIFDCANVVFSTGVNLDENSCQCIIQYQWDPRTRSCTCLPYARKLYGGICECLEGYQFRADLNRCVVECPLLGMEPIEGEDQVCKCSEQSYFGVYEDENSDIVVGCRRNCSMIVGTLNQTIRLDSCLCPENTQWTGDFCQTNCKKITNAVAQLRDFDEELNRTVVSCQCAVNYLWVKQNGECGRNCSEQKYINKTAIPTSLTCPCINTFQWDIFSSQCKIDCQMINFTESYSLANNYSCECRQFFLWNKTDYKCKINCSEIYDAEERIADGQCSCKNDKKFNSSGLMCQTTMAEEAFGSPWIIAVLGAGAVFVIVVFFIMVKFCWKFASEKKQNEKRLKTKMDPPKRRRYPQQNMRENLKSAQRMHLR